MNNNSRKTILVADDNEDSRILLRTFLEAEGYRVLEAENGIEAVLVAEQEIPDLILMDLNMPVLDGISAARHIRTLVKLCKIPILANSADGQRGIDLFSDINKFGKAYIGYIPKPLSFDELTEQINLALFKIKKAA